MKKQPNADNPLTVKVLNGKLVISVGVNRLLDDYTKKRLKPNSVDFHVLAQEVAKELERQDETGWTLIAGMLDSAVFNVIDNGSLAFSREKEPKRKRV